MGAVSNPLTGAAWGASPNTQNSPTPMLFNNPMFSPVSTTPPNGNPGNLPNPDSNAKDIGRNSGLLNVQQGQLRNSLIPLFTNAMSGAAGPAADFFKNLMNLGSPFYQQKQQEAFTQGTKDNSDAQAAAKQKLAAQGYGATPSGAEAGMIGGMEQSGAQSLATNFLQQLFQNENLQMQGAQGMQSIAQMFNPANLFGNVSQPMSTQGPAAADQVAAIMGSLFGNGGVSSVKPGSGGGN